MRVVSRIASRLVALTAVAFLAVAAQTARADIAVDFVSVTGSGPFTWTYDATLAPRSEVEAPPVLPRPANTLNFFTIYDFNGFTGVETHPMGWAFSSALVGLTPAGQAPADSPAVLNLTWSYVGPPTEIEGSLTTTTDLGLFTAESIYGNPTSVVTAAASERQIGAADTEALEVDANNSSLTLGPGTPEPMSLTLLCIGAPVLGAYVLRRRMARA